MDIAFAFDEGYADHVPVAVESVLECHPGREDLTLWLLTTAGVKAARERELHRQVDGRAQLRLMTAGEEFRSLGTPVREVFQYISTGMYLRLLLPGRLPSNVERVLYLDTDVLVEGDLSPLWEMALGQAPLAAVRDHFTGTINARGGVPGAPPELDGSAPYFNSGVLLIQTRAWRELEVTKRCLDYLDQQRERLRLPDQDALNLVTHGRWVELEGKWNNHVSWWNPDAPPDDVRVMHFLGPKKPWHDDFQFAAYRERYIRLRARVASGSWIS
ncbi:MAG TPA: hypothetical protein DGT23_09650 [Micromonosporaceae bacterium]|nr:hypothetical protein [Micromonosporaceae bacterium]